MISLYALDLSGSEIEFDVRLENLKFKVAVLGMKVSYFRGFRTQGFRAKGYPLPWTSKS